MSAIVKTALSAALVATVLSSVAPATVAAKSLKAAAQSEATVKRGVMAVHPTVQPKTLTRGTQGQTAGQDNTFCGNADVFVMYEEDENGDPVPGTKEYGCTD